LEVSTLKYVEIHIPIKDDDTWSTFNNTSQCLNHLRQQKLGV